jgi:hypothetical protein
MSSRQSIPERGKCLHFQRALIWTRDENRHVISTCRILDTCEWAGRPALGGFNPPCQIGRAALGATCAETNVLSPQDSADLDLGVSVAEFKRRRGAELCWAGAKNGERSTPNVHKPVSCIPDDPIRIRVCDDAATPNFISPVQADAERFSNRHMARPPACEPPIHGEPRRQNRR